MESTFHTIGRLLDQLAAVAAAFQGYLRQDLSAGIELPNYSRAFLDGVRRFDGEGQAFRASLDRASADARALHCQLAVLTDHSIHLRSCTFTLKVISARYPEISGFAEEMAEYVGRIRAAVDTLSGELERVIRMARQVDESGDTRSDRPSLDEAFKTEPASMRIAAEEIDQMIARLMSTLQCGDIASQRLDHIVQAVEAVENAMLTPEDRARFLAMIDAQLDQTIADLGVNCGMFTENIELIASRIEVLAANADVHRIGLAENYRQLQKRLDDYFAELRSMLRRRGEQQALFAGGSDGAGTRRVEEAIDAIGSAVRDIYYMALNTTLSCGRIGGTAASAAPVTTEIRRHVQILSEASDLMASLCPRMTQALAEGGQMALDTGLEPDFAAEHERLSAQVHAMAERAREAWLSPAQLNALSRQLLGEMPHLAEVSAGSQAVQDHLGAYRDAGQSPVRDQKRVDELSERLFALYTMNSEREVHKQHFWLDIDSSDCEAINLFGDEAAEMSLDAVLF
ncbi:hypothetical protein [Gellertiella hungarica]|uniref:Methyl-accepting chemotaxis protein n=1 Tax=Gellertiella hungarica TaxID=1572859 RepID=A0A7W6NL22_9HYPH|nr:hypothetical protein [Gellertiella hungarica]MBB4066080.1 hypothetical protein [Gellertiella hungarica]